MWGSTKNNTGGHLKIRGTGENSNMRGHTKFPGGLKNRGGLLQRGVMIKIFIGGGLVDVEEGSSEKCLKWGGGVGGHKGIFPKTS